MMTYSHGLAIVVLLSTSLLVRVLSTRAGLVLTTTAATLVYALVHRGGAMS